MIATPENVSTLGEGLDHPECVCVTAEGVVYAGGEAGQVYRITPDGQQSQIGTTGGFLLGIAIDGDERIYACDMKQQAVVRMERNGSATTLSKGTADRAMAVPNYPVFDAAGNLYVSDSGEFFDATGTGCIFVIRPEGATEVFHAGPFRFANGLAIDPAGQWLYIVQSTAPNVVRVPLDRPNGPVEVTHTLPGNTVPDGLAFTDDGRLVICCYRPDVIYVGTPDGVVDVLIEDLTGELLSRPTNGALFDRKLYVANLGGWHLTIVPTDLAPAPVHRPRISPS